MLCQLLDHDSAFLRPSRGVVLVVVILVVVVVVVILVEGVERGEIVLVFRVRKVILVVLVVLVVFVHRRSVEIVVAVVLLRGHEEAGEVHGVVALGVELGVAGEHQIQVARLNDAADDDAHHELLAGLVLVRLGAALHHHARSGLRDLLGRQRGLQGGEGVSGSGRSAKDRRDADSDGGGGARPTGGGFDDRRARARVPARCAGVAPPRGEARTASTS